MKKSAPTSTTRLTLPHVERLLFTKHLSVMIKAGIPLSESLETLRDQSKSKQTREIIGAVLSDVTNGQPLTKALARHPRAFDGMYLSLVSVGEASGTLEKTLEFLAVQLNKNYVLSRKIQGAMLYPALVLLATICMGGFISLFILPKLVGFFEAFDQKLPITTQILLWFANFMKNYGVIVFLVLIVSFIIFSILIKQKSIKPYWHRTLLKIPFVGMLIKNGQLARFCRNLGILIQSGIPISEGVEITAKSLSNLVFVRDTYRISKGLAQGEEIASILVSKHFKEFPPLVSKMIAVGEKTGKLDESLIYLAEFYEEEIDNSAKNLTTILEPILLIGIGLVVAFVALAIITPIYQLTGSLRR